MSFKNIAYAPLNFSFDRQVFAKEYDQHIYPNSKFIANGVHTWEQTQNLNKQWNMVDPEIYNKCNLSVPEKDFLKRGINQWKMLQLLNLVTTESDDQYTKDHASNGGTFMRNKFCNRDWIIKPEYQNLEIVKWIFQNLPFKKIISIHCVSLDPGEFASIHRDGKWVGDQPNTAKNNGIVQQGFVVITLNISDGGVPLFWSLDGNDIGKPMMANDNVYMISDYFLHGVPVCSSRRRQIRITGVPTVILAQHIDSDNKICLSKNFKFDKVEYPG